MNVEVKKVDDVRRELRLEVPKDRVSKALDEVYSDLSKKIKIKGYRPGKIPRNVLESRHAKLAQEEMIQKIVPEVYQEAVDQEKLFPIDMPSIEDVQYKDGIVCFKAKFDVKPTVTIKDYKGIKVKRKSDEVKDEEIEKTFDYFKQGQGQGDEKKEEVKIDDTFAKGLGYPSLDDFKKVLRKQLEIEKEKQNKADIENQIVESILKKGKLTIPQSLVQRQMERRVHDMKHRLEQQGMKKEDIEKKVDEIRKELKEPVERDVKVYLILDKIAELENIKFKEGENLPAKVIEFLLKEANWG